MTAASRTDIAVYIGRFQPLHNGHLALLRQALDLAAHVAVVIGSAHQARTPKNPFTWQERADIIRLALPEADRARVHFLPIRDYYDEARWVEAVRADVAGLGTRLGLAAKPAVSLVGHFKDATSGYLGRFPGWTLHAVERSDPVDAVHIRDALFGAAGTAAASGKVHGTGTAGFSLEPALAALRPVAPASTLDFLRAWAALPYYPALAREWQMLRTYKQAWSAAPYPPVFVTVDSIVRCAGRVLLIKRGQPPGVGLYAVPGGFIEQRETAYQSALRELREETTLGLLEASMQASLKGQAVFDHPDRSQRGRTISHAFYFDLGDRPLPDVQADDDAQLAQWVPISDLSGMEDRFHDDHFHMLDHFLGITR
ncbi:bifunctional nicotinamide-nucleotide adenylyltransferase/Nudix hydroxylase [Bordetella genomosp. 13]|uniref:bifunctional nicotinamide-nucleotide adenylyltransferase/Nudix hydroxylase n=1 Tax=Bordetella genomosp. 13 TaxID=463040 RepID=UPI0011AA9E97|nr:bifunctional nicotinamide-nucleotide adenylyltransferase/Nudix hydroxylase [Bordetella genomosp. 13]